MKIKNQTTVEFTCVFDPRQVYSKKSILEPFLQFQNFQDINFFLKGLRGVCPRVERSGRGHESSFSKINDKEMMELMQGSRVIGVLKAFGNFGGNLWD